MSAWRSGYEGVISYRLYALSNARSMFALISYPVLLEPAFTTRFQVMGCSPELKSFPGESGPTSRST